MIVASVMLGVLIGACQSTYGSCLARCELARPYMSEIAYFRCIHNCAERYGRYRK